MSLNTFTVVVYQKRSGTFEAFLYGPGETVPSDVFCSATHETKGKKPDKQKLRELLKTALEAKGVKLSQVGNLDQL